MLSMLKALHRHLVLVTEQVVVQTVSGRELIARNGPEILQHGLAVGLTRREGTGADVFPPVIPAPVAEIGREQRILRELPFPLSIEERVERTARIGRARRSLGVAQRTKGHDGNQYPDLR